MPRIKVGPPRRDMGDGRLPRISYRPWDRKFAGCLSVITVAAIAGGFYLASRENQKHRVCSLGEREVHYNVGHQDIFRSGLPENTGVWIRVVDNLIQGGDKEGPFPAREIYPGQPASFEIITPSGKEVWKAEIDESGEMRLEYSCKPGGKER